MLGGDYCETTIKRQNVSIYFQSAAFGQLGKLPCFQASCPSTGEALKFGPRLSALPDRGETLQRLRRALRASAQREGQVRADIENLHSTSTLPLFLSVGSVDWCVKSIHKVIELVFHVALLLHIFTSFLSLIFTAFHKVVVCNRLEIKTQRKRFFTTVWEARSWMLTTWSQHPPF